MQKQGEQFNRQLKRNFKQKQFENLKLLHKILHENITLKEICNQYHLTFSQAAKKIRTELNSISK